ncbi:hypothetical protein V3391_15465 [Luteimonas sp. SMYT11W]|uniref:Uncharacterized protein n=1 Tax=Luteimonas flava TaxID=3115822 RepID=A0ABU7WI11_9GAMM
MRILRQLLFVEISGLLSLLIVAVGMSVYGAIDSTRYADSLLSPAESAKLMFGYTLIIGFLPVFFIGSPGYLLLLRKHLARWPHALSLGVLPGFLVLAFEPSLGFWAIICGSFVALLTHVMCSHLGTKISFNPTPLRGAD